MGLFDQLTEKYNYSGLSSNYDIAIVCPGINPDLWQALHANLSSNEATFLLIFIGHVRPSFTLPENMVHIFSEMGPCPCGDIGHQFVFDNNLADHVLWMADDQHFDKSFLDDLLSNYTKHKLDYPDRPLGMSPVSRARDLAGGQMNGPDCMGWPHDGKWGKHGLTICANLFMSIEDAKALGGADKRFKGLDSHIDRELRVYSDLKGILIVLSEEDCKPTQEYEGFSKMSMRTGKGDRILLVQLFCYKRLDNSTGEWQLGCYDVAKNDEVFWTEKRGGHHGVNYFSKQRWTLGRTSGVQAYTREELKFEEPNISHTRIIKLR
jgi:hypothetical protein